MLSRGKVTPATVSYYSDEVARGIEDYYAGRGEASGVWLGAGSANEGLEGEVSAEALARVFDARHPRTGDSLGAPYTVRDGFDRVTGWDLTFSAPKSASVLWAVGGGDIGTEVRDAHHAAVRAALAYLEEHAAFSRTGKAGVRQVDTHGLLAAGFVHRSSRAGDPQLHTHVLVSGRVRCDDGVWRSLDSRAMHRQLKPGGMVYQAALRAELTERLGVAWTSVDRNGQAEITGVPMGLRRVFAQRRAAVEVRAAELVAELEAKAERSLSPAERRRAFERAVLETRHAKIHGVETDVGLHDRWTVEAERAGHAPASWIGDTVRRPALSAPEVADVVQEIVNEVARSTSTWRRADVVRAAARRAPASGTADEARAWIESTVGLVLAHPSVLTLAAPELTPPDELIRRDGRCVFDRHDAARYTTLATLEIEQRVVDLADAGRHAGRAVADTAAVERALVARGLSVDQADVVRTVTQNGDTVICVVGPAGAGKSRAIGAAAEAWTATGIPVRGLAVSAVAAGVLAEQAEIPSETIAKFLFEHDRPRGPDDAWRLRPNEVMIVDEAGMVASRDLARLALLADEADATLVLVGDHAQLGAVEAGGLFRLLADRHCTELTGVRRFTHHWEREASLRLRSRDPNVLAIYEEHGRFVESDRLGVLDHAARISLEARSEGDSLVVCATDHATVSAICDKVRAARVRAGEVEPGGVAVGAQVAGAGDEIVTLRNDRSLTTTTAGGWVRNGDRWVISERHSDGSVTVSHLGGHGRTHLPADYVDEHVALAYALTVHKAQGVTVDRAVVVVDDATTAEALYVGMTRGRNDNTALVNVDTLDEDRHDAPAAAQEVVAAALCRTVAEQAAIEVLRDTFNRSESLAVLAPRLANVDAQLRRDTPDDPEPELRRLAARRAYLERHARPRLLTRAGRDDRRRLQDLDQRERQLAIARDQRDSWLTEHAEVIAYRDDLAVQVDDRRKILALNAVSTEPAHVVALLGPVPDEPSARERWATLAGRVEAYREEWDVEPDHIRTSPIDGVQYREWTYAVRSVELIDQIAAVGIEHLTEPARGLEI